MASKTSIKTREKGAGTIYLERKRWYLKIRIAGKAKTKMLRNEDGSPCTNKDDAYVAADGYRKILLASDKEEMAVQIAEAKKLRRQSSLTMHAAWDAYVALPDRPDSSPSTMENYESIFRMFREWITKEHPEIDRIAIIDKTIAREYLAALWKSGISARTYNAYVQALRMIFKHLAESAGLEENPFDGVPHKATETISRREFSAEQVEKIFSGFQNGFFYETEVEKLSKGRKRLRQKKVIQYHPMHEAEMQVLLNLCCWTGCRGQDGCLMEWKNVNLETNQISYIPRKTARRTRQRAVTLPLHPNLAAALREALTWRNTNQPGEDFILPNVAHRYHRNPSGVQGDVMKIIRCATGLNTTAETPSEITHRKLPPNAYSLHSFRHTFVSFCANAGVPLAIVAEIVGHGNPAMTQHYSHITTEAKLGAINALPEIRTDDRQDDVLAAPETQNIDAKITDEIKLLTEEQKEALLKYLRRVP